MCICNWLNKAKATHIRQTVLKNVSILREISPQFIFMIYDCLSLDMNMYNYLCLCAQFFIEAGRPLRVFGNSCVNISYFTLWILGLCYGNKDKLYVASDRASVMVWEDFHTLFYTQIKKFIRQNDFILRSRMQMTRYMVKHTGFYLRNASNYCSYYFYVVQSTRALLLFLYIHLTWLHSPENVLMIKWQNAQYCLDLMTTLSYLYMSIL